MLKSPFQNKDSRFLTAVQHLNRVSLAFRQPLEFDHHFWAALTPWFDLEPWQSDNLVWLKHFVSKWFYNLNVAWPLVCLPRRLCSLQLHIVLPVWGRNSCSSCNDRHEIWTTFVWLTYAFTLAQHSLCSRSRYLGFTGYQSDDDRMTTSAFAVEVNDWW